MKNFESATINRLPFYLKRAEPKSQAKTSKRKRKVVGVSPLTMMISCRIPMSLLLLLLVYQSFIVVSTSSSSPLNPSTSNLLQDVVKKISAKQKWVLEDTRVSKLDLRRLRFGTSQRYEFRIGLGKTSLLAKFSDEVGSWKKFRKPKHYDFGSLVNEVSSMAVLDTFKVEGPLDLRVDSSDAFPSLLMPMNITLNGLNRILVGEGITVEVRRAREVSAFHASDIGLPVNGSFIIDKENSDFWPFSHSFCIPLVPVHVLGSTTLVTTLVAYRTGNPDAYIETNYQSRDTIELLAEKCYGNHKYRKQARPIDSLSSRMSMLEKILRSLGKHDVGFYRGTIKTSAVIRFRLELERNSGSNVTRQAKAGWRTRPTTEWVWFEVLARVEEENLKLVMVKKLEPFIVAETAAWSSLMSNISFTKFPSILVPPEALTLDVKW